MENKELEYLSVDWYDLKAAVRDYRAKHAAVEAKRRAFDCNGAPEYYREYVKELNELRSKCLDFKASCKDFTTIMGTRYLWQVPYHLDVDRYKKVINSFQTDEALQVVTFGCKVEAIEGDITCKLYIYPVGDDMAYDCECFEDRRCGWHAFNRLESKLTELLGCVTDIDKAGVDKLIMENVEEIVALEDINERLKKAQNEHYK